MTSKGAPLPGADSGQDRDRARAELERGRELLAAGRTEKAIKAFEAAVKADPGLEGAHERLADALASDQRWKPAFLAYQAAIERHPESAELRVKLGDMIRRSGNDDQAAFFYRQAAELGWGAAPEREGDAASGLYLDLLKRCLTFMLWEARDGPMLEFQIRRPLQSLAHLVARLSRKIRPPSDHAREFGLDWPAMALTMVGRPRLDNVQYCVEEVIREEVPGDLIEAGVWRGGVPILMRAILKAHGVTDRRVWVADSFAGLPEPDEEKYPADRGFDLSVWRSLAVSQDEVRGNFARFGLLDEQVRFLEGWFKDTLPAAPIERLAVMRLDGDLYESTMDGLVHLYPKLSAGGYAIIDDYHSAPPCQQAVDDYRREHGIREELVTVDWSGAYWRRR